MTFAHARLLLFSRTGLSNLLNKIQFTFEIVQKPPGEDMGPPVSLRWF